VIDLLETHEKLLDVLAKKYYYKPFSQLCSHRKKTIEDMAFAKENEK